MSLTEIRPNRRSVKSAAPALADRIALARQCARPWKPHFTFGRAPNRDKE